MRRSRESLLASAFQHCPILDARLTVGALDRHRAPNDDITAEQDVADDIEPLASDQRRRPGGETLLELGQQLVVPGVELDDGGDSARSSAGSTWASSVSR